jgi:peptidoglycan/LPS O-acetylase OafA/YrhL
MNKFHLKGLDTIRAVAAIIVVIAHIEQLKNDYNLPNIEHLAFFKNTGGHTAVILFFVLSGYLITILLLKEKNSKRGIDFKKFYLRRILRIWPLYFSIIFLSYFLLDNKYDSLSWIMCLTILPNIAHVTGHGWIGSPQIWSIGVEEQFYLGWPIIISKVKKWLLGILITLLIAISILPHIILYVLHHFFDNTSHVVLITNLFSVLKFNCMAIGGIIAYLYYTEHALVKVLKNIFLAYAIILCTLVFWLLGITMHYFTSEVYAMLFSIIILNISTNPNINLDNKLFTFLGKISYGIYMFHWIIILLIIKPVSVFFEYGSIIGNVIFYIGVLGLTILISYVSYTYFESRFLNLKDKYFQAKF